jgi:hypothetical protein
MRPFLAAAVLAAAALGTAAPAMAAAPTGQFADFKYCPYNNPNVVTCVYSVTNSGSFKLGNANVPITAATPIVLQGGIFDDGGDVNPWYNAVGADTLSKTRLKVPGGLLGLIDQGGLTGLLITALNNAIAAENDVYATAELVGPVGFSVNNTLFGTGTAVSLPVRVHLENPFLGSSCYIGSSSNPVRMKLTTGTTAPPPPNTPITGSPGTPLISSDGMVINDAGLKLVDNSLAAPAASNCGLTFLDKLLITPAVNLKEGLPAAAGKNSAILGGTTRLGNASGVAGSVQ